MSNTLAAFGFAEAYHLGGAANMQQRQVTISSSAGAIYFGDPVTSNSSGFIVQSTAGTTQIAGIFVGCQYISSTQKKMIWNNYWPGSDAAANPTAWIIADPNTVFRAQCGNGSIVQANVGNNIQFAIGSGNSTTGLSGAYLDQTVIGTTSTLPFRIVGLITDPPGANGTDTTSNYNWAYVAFNWQDFKSTTGI